jgi:hypothetical protein
MSSEIYLVRRSSIGLTILMILILTIGGSMLAGNNSSFALPQQSDGEGSGTGGGPVTDHVNPQGTEIQALPPGFEGFYVDATTGWSHQGVALGGVAIDEGELVVAQPRRRAAADLVGTRFDATLVDGKTVAMRITGVVPHKNLSDRPPRGPRRSDYVIEYQSGHQWAPLCPPESPAAILVSGSFGHAPDGRPNGDYDPTRMRLTFACRDGVAAKCQDWGYWSWKPERATYFQACTRMARADYCGTGRSRTVDETMINYLDLHRKPLAELKPVRGFVPEAVWGPGTAGKPPAAMCLSRTRWSTIPLGPRSVCSDLLPDPRDEAAADGKPQRFCDGMTATEWAAAGALFVNSSRPLDVGLVIWSDGSGHYRTTARHPWLGGGVNSPSPPGYPVFVSIEGAAFKAEIPAPKKKGLVPLFRYTKKTRAITLEVLTTEPPPEGFGNRALEAYVLEFKLSSGPPTSTARPLYLHSGPKDHYVTSSEEQAPANSSYSKVRQIGWLPH